MQGNVSYVRVSNFNQSSAVVELNQSMGQQGDGFMFSFLGSSLDTVTYLCVSCVPLSEPFPELKLAPVHQLFLCHLNSSLQLSLTLSILETVHSCNHSTPVLCFLCVNSTSSEAKWSTFKMVISWQTVIHIQSHKQFILQNANVSEPPLAYRKHNFPHKVPKICYCTYARISMQCTKCSMTVERV